MKDVEYSWSSIPALRRYGSDTKMKAFLDDLARRSRPPSDNATLVDDVIAVTKCDRQEAISLLQLLELCDCGRFVTGRRGKPSRFEWTFPATEIAKEVVALAKAASSKPESIISFVEHAIWLRPGVQVTVRLPDDTTKEEAEKIAGVVKNLWLTGTPSTM